MLEVVGGVAPWKMLQTPFKHTSASHWLISVPWPFHWKRDPSSNLTPGCNAHIVFLRLILVFMKARHQFHWLELRVPVFVYAFFFLRIGSSFSPQQKFTYLCFFWFAKRCPPCLLKGNLKRTVCTLRLQAHRRSSLLLCYALMKSESP